MLIVEAVEGTCARLGEVDERTSAWAELCILAICGVGVGKGWNGIACICVCMRTEDECLSLMWQVILFTGLHDSPSL